MRYIALAFLLCACGDDNKPASCSNPGGAVAGAADTHCTDTVAVNQAECTAPVPDGGAETEPPTNFNAEADDDDCKYHLKWTATTVCANSDVFFTLVATLKGTTTPVTGANPSAEVFLSDTHPAPNTNQASTESPAGTYRVGPVRFDASGQWTVRFHLFETCHDTEASPHGHGAFFVSVP
jgi:hypothetical protein